LPGPIFVKFSQNTAVSSLRLRNYCPLYYGLPSTPSTQSVVVVVVVVIVVVVVCSSMRVNVGVGGGVTERNLLRILHETGACCSRSISSSSCCSCLLLLL